MDIDRGTTNSSSWANIVAKNVPDQARSPSTPVKSEIAVPDSNRSLNSKHAKVQFPHSKTNVSVYGVDTFKPELNEYKTPTAPNWEIKQKWRAQQIELSKKLVETNDFRTWSVQDLDVTDQPTGLKYIGGVDISFAKDSHIDACACVVICQWPSLDIVWEAYSMIKLTAPYIAGLLGFREVPFIVDILERLNKEQPQFMPQLLLVDGNGILHMRNFGSACHLGVLADIPCIGVAKKLLYADGITDEVVQQAFRNSKAKGNAWTAELIGDSGKSLAYAMKVPKKGHILYISPGHRVDLNTSLKIAEQCMIPGRPLPEPVYQADHLSREFLRLNYDRF